MICKLHPSGRHRVSKVWLLGLLLAAGGSEGSRHSHSAAHPAALAPRISARFPSLAGQMMRHAEFSAVTRQIAGRMVSGLQLRPLSDGTEGAAGLPADSPLPGHAALMSRARGEHRAPEAGTANSIGLRPFFPSRFSDPFVVEGGGLRAELRAAKGEPVAAEIEQGQIIYRGAYPHTDSLHAVSNQRSEEFLLLQTADAPRSFEYELQVSADVQVRLADGAVRLSAGPGRALVIEKPYVVDGRGERREDVVRWELGGAQGSQARRLTLKLEPEGLAYPLVIDPSWITTKNLSTVRTDHTATLLQNGQVLVAGGADNSSALNSAELYDPAVGSWGLTGSLATVRKLHTATLLRNGQVLVVGGVNGSSARSSAELYDPASGVWSGTGSLTTGRYFHTATLLPNGRVLAAGGTDAAYLNSAELYDPASGMWSGAGSLASARASHTATLLQNGKVLVAGGSNNANVLSSAELYDPATGSWSPTDTLLARAYHTATLLPNGKVLVAGGFNSASALSNAELYDPATGNWSFTAGSLAAARLRHTAMLLQNGKVLVAGGTNNNVLNSAELYNVGLGFDNRYRPLLTTATSPLGLGGKLTVTGSHFIGASEDAGGNGTQNSSANYPLVQLRSLGNEQIAFLNTDPGSNWTTLKFTSAPVLGFPSGPTLVTVFTNGIPSVSVMIQITNVALNPTSQSFTPSGGDGSFSLIVPGSLGWTAQSNDAWLHLNSPGAGFNSTTVTFTVDAQAAHTRRAGSLTVAGLNFTVLQGAAFDDVPTPGDPNEVFYNAISKLSARGITGGCGDGTNYCPGDSVTRGQMAVFLERAMRGSSFLPPPANCASGHTTDFTDVACPDFFANFIEQLFHDQITSGCGGGNYCPHNPVTREAMAIFIERALGVFTPPPALTQRFADVGPGGFSYSFVDDLALRGITGGCGAITYCPASPVTRGQMAIFLVRAFNL